MCLVQDNTGNFQLHSGLAGTGNCAAWNLGQNHLIAHPSYALVPHPVSFSPHCN